VPFTLAGLRHAARSVKRRSAAADKYPVSRRVGRRSFAALASVAAVLALPAATQATPVTEFSTGLTVANAPAAITAGPDGNLWFTEQGLLPGIGRITPSGDITEYPAALLQVPGDIVGGTDGGVWFTQSGSSEEIGRIDTATGAVTTFPAPTGAGLAGIDVDGDGNLWFGEADKGKVGRMATDGTVTEFNADLSGDDHLKDVAVGPDGWIYYTVENDGALHSISRVNPADGDICHFSAGLTGAPNKIVSASDGKLYFTISGDPAAIGRIKTDGTIKEFRSGLTADSSPVALAEGGDHDLWFTGSASPGRIGRMVNPSHAFTEFAGGTAGLGLLADADPAGITRGPDGNVWFTERGLDGRVARLFAPPAASLALSQKTPPVGRHEITDGELLATVAPNSQPTTYSVEYGPGASYGKQTDPVTVDGSSGAGAVTEAVPLALKASSHYLARLVATNEGGTDRSDPVELWTDAEGRLMDFAPEDEDEDEQEPEATPTPTGTPSAHGNSDQAHEEHGPDSTPAADDKVAAPVLGEQVVVHPQSGKVRVKKPGAKAFTPLSAGAQLPVGTTVDARGGKIVLQSARNADGRTQTGTFWGAMFQIRQGKRSKGMTDLVLKGGSFRRCGAHLATASLLARDAGQPKRRVVRRLWGKDRHSRFRTHGRDSVATVRGTQWVTTDRCDGTRTRVTQGKVAVRDLRRKRTVLVTAGHAYLARHRRHR
jgi:streptogramin lyase